MHEDLTNSYQKPPVDIFGRAVKSGFWLLGLRVFAQLLVLVRITILCRLLEPKDFGLLGVATLTMAMMLSFTEIGLRPALIQKKSNAKDYLDVAWTFEVIRSFVLFAVIYLVAPYVAAFFNRPDACGVIRLVAVSLILEAFTNIGTVYFEKELEFSKHFVLNVVGMLVGTVVAVILALKYRNVWALVIGRLAESTVKCAVSYVIHPYRPRISLNISKIKELWQFGRHIFTVTVLKYFCLHGDDALLGKMLGADALGFYQKAFQVGTMVANEIGNKVSQIAFPAYSKLQDNLEKLRAGYFKAVQLTSLIVFPIAGGIIVLAYEFTEIVLSAKWLPMVPAMQILCLLGPLKCMQRESVFMGMGRPDIITRLSIYRFVIMAATIYPLTVKFGMVGTSFCVLGTAVVLQPVGFYELKKLVGITFSRVLKILFLPIAATLLMVLSVFATKTALESVGVVWLLLLMFQGGIVYLVLILLAGLVAKDYNMIVLIRDILKGLK